MAKRQIQVVKKNIQISFNALSVEGALISPEWLTKIAQMEANQQDIAAYGIHKGLNIRDEMGRYWHIALSLWSDFLISSQSQSSSQSSNKVFIKNLLAECFGFQDIVEYSIPLMQAEKLYQVGLLCLDESFPVVISPFLENTDIDTAVTLFADSNRKRSAFTLCQEYLNASEKATWGIATDGKTIRILRDNSSLTRPAWIELDLERIFNNKLFSEFAAAWLLIHSSRFKFNGTNFKESIIESWRNESLAEGTRARNKLRGGVERAIEFLGKGFLANKHNVSLRKKLTDGILTTTEFHQELLRVIYRLIFLLTTEERELLHVPKTNDHIKRLYKEGYGIRRLRDRSLNLMSQDRYEDVWQSLKLVFDGLAMGEPRLGLPALGGLFDKSQCNDFDSSSIENKYFLSALFHLSWIKTESGLSRINWRDMGSEELGSVYESLLELVPQISQQASVFNFASEDEQKGNARKTSGSYYTPDSLVQTLLDSSLEPTIQQTILENPDNPTEALLKLKIVDPACGSGHFLLAAARRLAMHIARLNVNSTTSLGDFRHALRDVVSRCIFGVDMNPMAAELCRVGLWLESFEPGRPLSFLDHHIRVGNSLFGSTPTLLKTGIPQGAFEVIEGDESLAVTKLAERNKNEIKGVGPLFQVFDDSVIKKIEALAIETENLPDDSLTDIVKRSEMFKQREDSNEFRQRKLLADVWCAAFVIEKRYLERGRDASILGITQSHLTDIVNGEPLPDILRNEIGKLANEYGFFHWHLAFPAVFANGGFDCVIGNPPWDKINLKDEEYFAATHPDIANADNKSDRKKLLDKLEIENPEEYKKYLSTKRVHDGYSFFFRFSKRYPLTGTSRINLYSVFAELGSTLLSHKGRLGMVLSSGIATDDNNKDFFLNLINTKKLVHVWDFENRLKTIFPDVHPQFKFCLFSIGGAEIFCEKADLAFYLLDIEQLKETSRHFTLTAEELVLLNPTTKTCPTFRNFEEAELTKIIYKEVNPWTIVEKGTSWPGSPKTPFNMSNDSGKFVKQSITIESPELLSELLPLYESKLIHQFNHRYATFAKPNVDLPEETEYGMLRNQQFEIKTRYYVENSVVEARYPGNWNLVFRDVTSATNERTSISTILPKVAVGNTLSLIQEIDAKYALSMCSIMNSYVYDFCARQKVSGIHLNHFIWKQLPVLSIKTLDRKFSFLGDDISLYEWINRKAIELVYTSNDLENFASAVGYMDQPFVWDANRRYILMCELDAILFKVYLGNSKDIQRWEANEVTIHKGSIGAIEYIMDSFTTKKKRDISNFECFRTKNTIIEIYKDMIEAETRGLIYKTKVVV